MPKNQENAGFKICKHCKSKIPVGAKVCPQCKKSQGVGCLRVIGGVLGGFLILIILIATVGGSGDDSDKANDYAKNEQTTQKEDNRKESNESTEKKDEKTVESTPEPTKTKKEYMKSCKTYKYKKVLRNPDKYIGKRVKIKVKISSVHEKGLLTPTKYYLAYSNDEYDMWLGDQYGIFEKRDSEEPKLLEDDVVEVYGEIVEPEETSSLIVNSQELFCIDMKYAKLISE